MKQFKIISIVTSFLFLFYISLWPVSIKPEKWTPPTGPELTGLFEKNHILSGIKTVNTGKEINGFEDITVDINGTLYFGTLNGEIFKYTDESKECTLITVVDGPILGMEIDAHGNIIAAAPDMGLISVSQNGIVELLVSKYRGIPLKLANDVDIADDGIIYFSDTSHIFDYSLIYNEVMAHNPNGRFFSFDPVTRETRLLLDNLYFANGIAVSKKNDFVLIVEMTKYRILKYWITGRRKGETEVFIDNLPGMPDGISSNNSNLFWLALRSTRNNILDNILLPYPFLRKMLFRLPRKLRPKSKKYGFILGIDESGKIIKNMQDPDGKYAPITSVTEYNNKLYLGSTDQKQPGYIKCL
ncbi:MAG: strictosidine synthase family protein [Spirochaetes bacterium]|nr:strictosidine synthase family protein [Spirochaetota bacterium]MBN2769069.1 strictosidine synthase family protein [Spirochaetota bacterium]